MPGSREGDEASAARAVSTVDEFWRVAQVGGDAVDRSAAADGQPCRGEFAAAAHPGEQVAYRVAWLGGTGGPAGDRDGAAGDERGGEERRGVGQVGFHVHDAREHGARMHPP